MNERVAHPARHGAQMHEVWEPTRQPGWTLGHEGRQLLSESTIESRFTSATNFWACAPSQRWDRAGASASIFQPRVRWTARSVAIRTASRTMQAAPGDGEASWIGTAMQNTTGGETLQISA
jgi:hypothetical protein